MEFFNNVFRVHFRADMPVHSKRKQLAAHFATAARLYAEAVVSLTSGPDGSAYDYYRPLENVQKAKQYAESAALAFQECVDLHHREEKAS
jgi:hypothetical protein